MGAARERLPGLLLQGVAFIAIGILISSLTENQIVAAVATFGTLLIFWVIAWASDSAGGTLGRVLPHVVFTEHFDSFAKGVIDTKDLIYYSTSQSGPVPHAALARLEALERLTGKAA